VEASLMPQLVAWFRDLLSPCYCWRKLTIKCL
jgi:hypothetical protein